MELWIEALSGMFFMVVRIALVGAAVLAFVWWLDR